MTFSVTVTPSEALSALESVLFSVDEVLFLMPSPFSLSNSKKALLSVVSLLASDEVFAFPQPAIPRTNSTQRARHKIRIVVFFILKSSFLYFYPVIPTRSILATNLR